VREEVTSMAGLILEIVEGDDAGRQVQLADSIEIGRDRSTTLPLEDAQVSRRHARVWGQGDLAIVEDLGSTNGTYVNGQPIAGPRALRPGDEIRVGLTVLQLRTAEDVQRQASAVQPIPQLTRLGRGVLEPVSAEELAPPPAAGAGAAPAFAAEETEPAFVPAEVAEDVEARGDYEAVARLADTRVKRQTNVAVIALLGAAGLAVLVVFGVR
jgi:pSer/pThr/pTyr-binding forkhead associated (FHA) protein